MQPIRCAAIVAATLAASLTAAPAAHAQSVFLGAAHDNTIYDDGCCTSNGAGDHLFTGMTAASRLRRGLLSFDVAGAVPPGATITEVTLTLHMSRAIGSAADAGLHRVLSDWGEGASDAPNEEGAGTPAEPGDATWDFTFFPTDEWDTQGGDFVAAASATTLIASTGFYAWSSDQLTADVQSFLDNPSENFGWLILGDEETPLSAKRFDTRENPTDVFRPELFISYVTCDAKLGDADGDGCVSFADILAVLRNWDMQGEPGILGDANCDGYVDFADITLILGTWDQGNCP